MGRYIQTSACTYTEAHEPHTYTFTGPCVKTGKPYSVTIPSHELWDLNQGKPIMCLESLDAGDREFANTGISPEGWGLIFA